MLEYDGLWWLVTRSYDAGEAAIPGTDRTACDDQTTDHINARLSVCVGDDPGIVCGLLPVEPSAVPGTGADAHGDSGGRGVACAKHLLAILGVAASGGGAATAGGGAADAAASVGGSPCGIERSHTGHRHDGADGVRPTDGSA